MFSQPAVAPAPVTNSFANNVPNNNIWMTNGEYGAMKSMSMNYVCTQCVNLFLDVVGFSNNKQSLSNAFVDDRSFTSVFGDTNTTSSSTTTTGKLNGRFIRPIIRTPVARNI